MEENINIVDTQEVSDNSTVNEEVTTSTEETENINVGHEAEKAEEVKETKEDEGAKVAKAFSQRLKKEKDKLSKEYEPYKKVIELASKNFNMSSDEYIKSILEDFKEDESINTPAIPNEKEELLNKLLEEKKEKEIADEWNKRANILREINPKMDIDSLPDELFSNENIPLEYAYAYHLLTSDRENFTKILLEKELQKINKVNRTSGSLSSNTVNTNSKSISQMSSKDFELLKEKVKRGEVKSLI